MTIMTTTTQTHELEPPRPYADYNVHHSGITEPLRSSSSLTNRVVGAPQPVEFDPTLAPHPEVPYQVENPSWWTRSYRRVPDYRPANRNLDRAERAQSPVVSVVAVIMLTGCSAIAVSSLIF